jgi:asparagine synthase (glutamine-hydrolysing)
MCGLVGFTTTREDGLRDVGGTLNAMLSCIAYRGPDQEGTWIGNRLALGHNRLSIMAPDGGRQPRVDESSGNALIFNGEIYGHRRFDSEILQSGNVLRDHCDTETLFWLLSARGVGGTLRTIDGMFAFAFYDAGDDTLYLARDEFGQKPLYFAEIGGELIFASEMAALRQHPLLRNVKPDMHALSLYLMMEYVPGEQTGIAEIRELPRGHMLRYRDGVITISRYAEKEQPELNPGMDEADAVRRLDGLLQTAIEQQLVADVPLGIFLSGGLDSSLVAAIARQHHPDVSTFTVKFDQASFDESAHAEEVARHLGTRHHTIELSGQNCADAFDELIARVDQPLADSSLLPTFLLCQATRRHVTVALGGDGADELFVGYPNFRLLWLTSVLAALPMSVGKLLRGVADRMPDSHGYMNWRFLLRQLGHGVGIERGMQSVFWMSALAPMDQTAVWQDQPGIEKTLRTAIGEQLRDSGGDSVFEQWRLHFLYHYLAYDILLKTDRASMYNSLEVRSPFLATDVARFALTLPPRLLFRGGKGKYLLRRVADAYLPRDTVRRRKHGFGMPVASMLRDDFRDVVSPLLLDRSNPMYEFLHYAEVRRRWDEHASKQRDNGKALWALFMLAVFCRRHF